MYGLFFHVQVFWVNMLIHSDKTFLWDVQKCNECNKAINKELFWNKFILRPRSLRGHPAACACGAGCIITHKLIPNHHTINSRQLLLLRIGNQSSALCPGGPFTPPDHGKEGRRERIGLRVRTERKVWFTCNARSVRPACTTLISNPDVSSATRAVCPYIGMQHGGDYCSLMPRTGRPESLGDEPTWITWFVVNDQKT